MNLKPYYDHAGITIYHDDCQNVLPHLPKVDLVLTDPPYELGYQSKYRILRHDKIYGDDLFPVDLINQALDKAKCASYIFCRWNNLIAMPKPKSVLVWVRNGTAGDLRHAHGRQWEAICFYPAQKHRFIKRTPDVLHVDPTRCDLHPTEKPVSLLKQLLDCNVGETVLDPFMGVGSTLIASKLSGRKCIGVEHEEKYCEIAARRLAQAVLDF